jgi:hypothetical protein
MHKADKDMAAQNQPRRSTPTLGDPIPQHHRRCTGHRPRHFGIYNQNQHYAMVSLGKENEVILLVRNVIARYHIQV